MYNFKTQNITAIVLVVTSYILAFHTPAIPVPTFQSSDAL
jgi:hypothetical protein